mgnify:CR=1 FL=1
MSIFGSSFETLLPVFADNVISGGIHTYSRLLLSEGVGGLAGMAAIIFLGFRVRAAQFYILSCIGFGIGLVALSQTNWLLAAAPVIATLGTCRVVFQTMSTTLMQTLSSNEFRGRVMSLEMFSWGAAAVGGLLMGAMGQYAGVRTTLSIGGIVVTSGAVAIFLATLRSLVAPHDHSEP